MLQASTIQLLRFKFSFFLMPVFWFAFSQVKSIHLANSILLFIILHLLLYPASNGYNSFMDKDTQSIGGIKNPLPATTQLFYVTLIMDIAALLLSFVISWYMAMGILSFILASRAYSYRGIRLKKYAVISFFITMLFQGALVFFLTYHGSNSLKALNAPFLALLSSSLLVGSFYPLTQIYQHKQDEADGVITLSKKLGYTGTFIFSGIIFVAAMSSLALYFYTIQQQLYFTLFSLIMLPTLFYYFWWFAKVIKNNAYANFVNTMKMNIIASICTNAGFITILIIEKF